MNQARKTIHVTLYLTVLLVGLSMGLMLPGASRSADAGSDFLTDLEQARESYLDRWEPAEHLLANH